MFEFIFTVIGLTILLLVARLADEKDEYWGNDGDK